MPISDLFNLISKVRMQNGDYFFNNTRLDIHEAAFLNYYYIKFKNPDLSKAYLVENERNIGVGDLQFFRAAFWLWNLGEYVNKTSDTGFLNEHMETVKKACSIIGNNWDKNLPNWLLPEYEGVFLSNISLAYGALLSISNNLKTEYQKLIIDIRRNTFESFLRGGKITSEQAGTMYGDLSIISVPFALLDAGNQIMVESIDALEKELIKYKVSYMRGSEERADLTLLLSWYYTERGEMASARKLLHRVMESWTDKESCFSYIMLAIAKGDIESKDSSGKNSQSIMLKHIPCGFQNPYRKESYERLPNHPEEGEEVVLNLAAEPIRNNQNAYINYRVGNRENRIKMEIVGADGGEEHYSASIGAFNYKDLVEYYFIVDEGKEGEEVKSEVYSFSVRKWLPAGKLVNAIRRDDYILLQLDGLSEYKRYLNIKVRKEGKNSLKFELSKDTELLPGSDESTCKLIFETFELEVDILNESININDLDGGRIRSINLKNFIELLCDEKGIIHKLRYDFDIEESEKFFGMGERFSRIEYKGLDIDNYVYNQYRDQGLKTYIPAPFTISSGGYGIYLDTAYYSMFRFGTRKAYTLEIETEVDCLEQKSDMYLFYGAPMEIIPDFLILTGKPVMVPKWSLGPWMSSNNWDNQREVLSQVDLTKKFGIPATVLVIEQWSDEATFYIFNDAQYELKDGRDALQYNDFRFENWGRWPDPKTMVDYLHKMGIKVLLWQAPDMKYMDGISHAQRDEDERVMLEMGYHVKRKDGSPYRVPYYEWFKGSLVPDFTNSAAASWWLKKREYLLTDLGIDGFKTDGGECIYSDDTVFSNGKTGAEMRNLYPNLYVKAFWDYAASHTGGESITFSRAGYTGAQTVPIHWAGDERSTFEAFRASIRAGLSAGMSGLVFWGWDIGGFNGEIPTAELFIRSTEMAALCPIMQYHAETKGEYNRDRTPWNIANRTNCPEVIDIYRKYANLRMNLLPYIYSEAVKSVSKCVPMMRSMFLQYPMDSRCMDDWTQYFFGEDLLVAPVINEGERGRKVYLTEGSWCGLLNGTQTAGGENIYVDAELNDIPVFIKENSIIPLNLDESLELCSDVGNSVEDYKNLTFLMYIVDSKAIEFTDDLGNRINISVVRKNGEISLEVKSNYREPVNFILRCIEDINRIIINGVIQEGVARENEMVVKGWIYNE